MYLPNRLANHVGDDAWNAPFAANTGRKEIGGLGAFGRIL